MKRQITDSRTLQDNLDAAQKIANRRSPAKRRDCAADLLERYAQLAITMPNNRPDIPSCVKTPKQYREYATRNTDIPNAMGLKALAVAIGNAYHKHIKALASSAEASVVYGKGGQEEESRNYYSKGWHAKYGPKCWKNGGAKLTGLVPRYSHGVSTETIPQQGTKGLSVVLQSHLGKDIATIALNKLPAGWRKRCQGALLDNEILGINNGTHIARYDTAFHKTGVAVPLPADLINRFGKYEHGKTVGACKAEIAHKRQIIADEAIAARDRRRNARKLHLIGLLCLNLKVTYEHARKAGLCDQGIRRYCEAHGFSVDSGAPAGLLRRTRDSRALQAIAVAAKDLLK